MSLALALRLALGNVRAYAVKNLIVGSILAFGTLFVVAGAALLNSLERAMQTSVTNAITGELQVYARDARDPLSVMGDMGMTVADIGEIDDVARLREVAATVPEVATVIPMGIGQSTVFGGNDIDIVLGELRSAVNAGDTAKAEVLLGRARRIASDLAPEMDNIEELTSDTAKLAEDRATLARVTSDTFPAEFAASPIPTLDWMDSHLAPLATDGKMIYLRLVGADLDAFTRSFTKFELVEGAVPARGERGLLIPENYYQLWMKNTVARELDQIRDEVRLDGESIGTSGVLFDRVQRNSRQYRRILYQLDPAVADALEPEIRAQVGGIEGDMASLLKAFLAVTDENLESRYAFFYKEIAPNIRLYDIKVGDTLPLRAFTRSGYLKSLNVRFAGIYRTRGYAGREMMTDANTLIDLVSFRDLYGKMTDSQRAELADIKASVGARDVGTENIEDALFGGGSGVENTVTSGDGFAALDALSFGAIDARVSDTYPPEQLDSGLALNAAIRLKDPSRVPEGQAALQAAIDKAGLPLQVVDWRTAAGMIGQLVSVVQVVMIIAVGVMFLVSMVIINNALVMATMERTAEIGTMRAVGAKKSFVVTLFVLETLLVAIAAALVGSAGAAALVGWLGSAGIPAGVDMFSILFGGPFLYPSIGLGEVCLGVGLVSAVSVLATLYPAILAAGVPPVVALQSKE